MIDEKCRKELFSIRIKTELILKALKNKRDEKKKDMDDIENLIKMYSDFLEELKNLGRGT